MSKKIVYKVKPPDATFFAAAINSAEDDYHLAWLLNSALRINLIRSDHLIHISGQNFPAFYYLDEVGRVNYTLVSNKMNNSYLIPQLKNVDYLIKISGTLTNGLESNLISKIRSLPEVTACILIKTGTPALINFLHNL